MMGFVNRRCTEEEWDSEDDAGDLAEAARRKLGIDFPSGCDDLKLLGIRTERFGCANMRATE
jgi:hypothetical protein